MGYVLAFLLLIALAIGGEFVCASMASDERAEQAAENVGLRNAHAVSKRPAWGAFGGCHESDVANITVVGIDSYGNRRTVEVCAPVPFGGYTIRN